MTVRKKQLEAFVKRGKTLEEQNYRRYLVNRQLRLEQEKNWKNFNAGLTDLLAKVFSGMDTAMSWGTAVAQDATGMPTGYAYNIPRTLTPFIMAKANKGNDLSNAYARDAANTFATNLMEEAVSRGGGTSATAAKVVVIVLQNPPSHSTPTALHPALTRAK